MTFWVPPEAALAADWKRGCGGRSPPPAFDGGKHKKRKRTKRNENNTKKTKRNENIVQTPRQKER